MSRSRWAQRNATSSFNRIFPWLSIRSKLIIAFTGLSVLPVVLVGLHSIYSNARLMKNIALENLTHDIQNVREKTANFLSGIEDDIRVMRHSVLLGKFVESLESSPPAENGRLREQLARELAAFAEIKGIYYQIRIIAEEGGELVCVEAGDAGGDRPSYRVVGDNQLRHAREPFYFLLVNHPGRERIAFVPGELNDRQGRRVAVISFAMPLYGAASRVGVMVVNVFAKDLFRVIEARRHLEVESRTILASGDGHYLYHSEKKKDWNKLLASHEEDNLQHDYPGTVVRDILSGRTGTITEGFPDYISYAPLFQDQDYHGTAEAAGGFMLPYFILESVSKDVILAPVYSYVRIFSISLIVFLSGAIGLSLLATRQFTRPIKALRDGAMTIASGQYGHRIGVESHDEIEVLADRFNAMAAALESREREILQHRARLEDMVEQRTHELGAEKTKLHAILDHVPSAIVLLDRNLRIQSASAAFSSISGSALADVLGKECPGHFHPGEFCRECVSRRVLETKKVETHVQRIDDRAGGHRFIEHIAIPMNVDGEVGAVLEIITDITDRKRIERNLVQTEKLAAAGEMAAIIAHEFRNSLTSVKLILQLQREVKRIGRSERESLGVALGSIDRMEKIVTELLNFARPYPMEFRDCLLNDLVEESLAFTRPHIEKHSIRVDEEFDATIPPLPLDAPHMKESLINLLLNAVDAIRNQDPAAGAAGGVIAIVTRRERLRKTLRDLSFTAGVQARRPNSGETEIVLSRGCECAVVELRDNGCGIADGNLRRIFDPFFTTKINGTGLGLPMVKRTVNAHGGIITAGSSEGGGSTFRIYLPLTSQS